MESETQGQQLFERVNRVCARFLERTVKYLGSVEKDAQILQALKKFQSVLEYAPSSAGSRDFRRLAQSTDQLPKLDQLSGGVQFFVERLARTAA